MNIPRSAAMDELILTLRCRVVGGGTGEQCETPTVIPKHAPTAHDRFIKHYTSAAKKGSADNKKNTPVNVED